MPTRADYALPLNAIRARARMHIASNGNEATNLYVHDAVYRAGEVLLPSRGDIVVPRDSVIVFADDEPLRNWGHACRYLLHDPSTGELTGEIPAILPPTLDFGSTFQPFHIASSFAQSAVRYPVVALPSWIYFEPSPRWYAILYSGASMNRHVNDIEFLYRTLTNLYAIPAANITVLNYDGTLDYNDANWARVTPPVGNWPGDNTPYQMKINGSGTKQALLDAIAAVGKKLGPNDNLLIHTNNHGNRVGNTSTIISYSGDDTYPTDLANAIQALPKFSSLMVMMEQCFSGGFIQPILNASPAACTSVATAADATHTSAGGPNYDPFALDWICAMALANPDGSSLASSPDSNGDGVVSAREAFNYALATDLGVGDTPTYGENSFCGGATTLNSKRRIIYVPPLYKYLFPWQILPDPAPDQIGQIAVQIAEGLQQGTLRQALGETLQSMQAQLTTTVRGAIGGQTPRS